MSNFSSFLPGNPIGAIVQGQFAGDSNYLLCDGKDYTSSSYPLLNKTGLETFGTNLAVALSTAYGSTFTVNESNGSIAVLTTSNGATNTVYTTTDGITFTARTLPTSLNISSVKWLNGQWVLVGISGSNYFTVLTSSDAVTWTLRYQDTNQSVTFASISTKNYVTYGNGLYVAVAPSTGGATFASVYWTSPDTITWTRRSSLPAAFHGQIHFNPVLGEFCVFPFNLDSSGTAPTFFYKSNDGINWGIYYLPNAGGSPNTTVTFVNNVFYLENNSGSYRSFNGGTGWSSMASGSLFPCLKINGYLFNVYGQYARETNLSAVSYLPYPQIIYAQNPVLIGNRIILGNTNTNGALFALDFDTTKFKVPLALSATDTDRYYIKAK